MNWEALGAVAETVGAVGVILTLVYLAAQVRQNTRAIRAQTYDSFVAQFRDWNQPMRSSEEMADRFQRIMEDVASLPPRELTHAVHVLYDMARLADLLHHQYQEGMVSDAVWEGWEGLFRAYLTAPGFVWYWERRQKFFAEDFNQWVRMLIKTADEAEERAAAISKAGSEAAAL